MARIETLFSLLPDVEIEGVVADRFLSGPLQDALSDRGLYTVEWRVNQWSTASEDVANFRRAVLDGTLAVVPAGRRLATLSLSHAEIKADDSGSVRLNKASMSRRDDVAAAIVLGVSACARLDRACGACRVRGVIARRDLYQPLPAPARVPPGASSQ